MKNWRYVFILGLVVPVLSCSSPNTSNRLHALFDEAWSFQMKEDPLFATSTGYHEFDDRLPSVTREDEQRRAKFNREILKRLESIDRSALDNTDQINYDMFQRQLQEAITEFEFRSYEMPLTVDTGFHINFARLPKLMPLQTIHDYDNYIARLRAFPTYVQQQIAVMRDGLERGFTQARVILEGYEVTIQSHIVDKAVDSLFYAPFRSFPTTIPTADQERLRAEGTAAILEGVVPGYRAFLDFMVNDYRPNARKTIGASDLPNGREYYRYLIKHYTTLDLTAEQVHQIGLDEVSRIHAEMMDIIKKVGFEGSFADFLEFLRTDPRFYAKTPEELLKDAAYIAKRMDGKLPSLFKTLPRLPYGIQPVPQHLAPKYTAGRYIGAPIGSTQPGYYWVNTYALDTRPLYSLEALTLHESVPGHHLQNALRQELKGLPNFRRFSGIGAFGEGWGLYCEGLGLEAGFYKDPYSNFGRLTYEMWRACRLVVDTGMHVMGWTRQQALDYLASNTALSLHEIKTETDRYISWPGQALSYKMGELKIRELRRLAEKALGDKFDVREFHDVILLNGPVPLKVLEKQVQRYIEEKSSAH